MKIIDLRILVEETRARVDSLITDELVLAPYLRDELRRLLDFLSTIHRVLSLPKYRYFQGYCSSSLKEIVYEAKDVIDELTCEILHPKVTLFNFLQKLTFNHKLSRKIKILNQSLATMNRDAIHYEATSFDSIIPPTRTEVDRLIDNPIIGREADASKIVNLLLARPSDQQVLTVVPIVGMRGLGKTSLANFVSQQLMALNHFDVKMWICVSEKFNELTVWGQMLRSLNATMEGLSLTNKKKILSLLERELLRKRFLLVLDDVWGDVYSWWDDFRTRLLEICTHTGNVVLVTTRSEEVASIVETSFQHRHTLDFLSNDDCWFIFKKRAFGYFTAYPVFESNLVAIGREIAQKCRGVPLATEALGGTLRFIMDERQWLN